MSSVKMPCNLRLPGFDSRAVRNRSSTRSWASTSSIRLSRASGYIVPGAARYSLAQADPRVGDDNLHVARLRERVEQGLTQPFFLIAFHILVRPNPNRWPPRG